MNRDYKSEIAYIIWQNLRKKVNTDDPPDPDRVWWYISGNFRDVRQTQTEPILKNLALFEEMQYCNFDSIREAKLVKLGNADYIQIRGIKEEILKEVTLFLK